MTVPDPEGGRAERARPAHWGNEADQKEGMIRHPDDIYQHDPEIQVEEGGTICECEACGHATSIHNLIPESTHQRILGELERQQSVSEQYMMQRDEAVAALRFYADERNWVNEREIRGVPGFHGSATARAALPEETSDATE